MKRPNKSEEEIKQKRGVLWVRFTPFFMGKTVDLELESKMHS